jgi:hypothetical protein
MCGVLFFQAGHAGSIPVARSIRYALKVLATGMIANLDLNRFATLIETRARFGRARVSTPVSSNWPAGQGLKRLFLVTRPIRLIGVGRGW